MIRPFTCLCMLLAAGAGLYLYQEKHRAQVLDREIIRVVKATEAARDRTGLFRAEWALLNEPDRLAGLAERHLALKPLAPAQFVQIADLGNRLPPVPAPGTPAPAMDETAPLEPAPPIVQAPVAPKVIAAVKPAVQMAAVKPHPVRPKPAELADAAPRPVYVPVVSAYAPAASAYAPAALRPPALQRVDAPSAPMVGSALGMARTMLPLPVPMVSTASASNASMLGASFGR